MVNAASKQVDDEDDITAEEVFLDNGSDATVSLGPLASCADTERSSPFEVTAPFSPQGDQPQAIQQILKQLEEKDRFSVLQGITGTGT